MLPLRRLDEVVAPSDEFLDGRSRIVLDRKRSLVEWGGIRPVALCAEYDQPLSVSFAEDDVVIDVLPLEDRPICRFTALQFAGSDGDGFPPSGVRPW